MSRTLKLTADYYVSGYNILDSTRSDRTGVADTGNALRLRMGNSNIDVSSSWTGLDTNMPAGQVKGGWLYEVGTEVFTLGSDVTPPKAGSTVDSTDNKSSCVVRYNLNYQKKLSVNWHVAIDDSTGGTWVDCMCGFFTPFGGTLNSDDSGKSGNYKLSWNCGYNAAAGDTDWGTKLNLRIGNNSASTANYADSVHTIIFPPYPVNP